MARLKLRWTPLAIADLDNACDFITSDRPRAAAVTLRKIAYRPRNDHLELLAIMHGARKWPDSFE